MSFGRVESGPGMVVLRPGDPDNKSKTLCDEPIRYVAGPCLPPDAYKADGRNLLKRMFGIEICPEGTEFDSTTAEGCDVVDNRSGLKKSIDAVSEFFVGKDPEVPNVRGVCRKTVFKKNMPRGKLECCLRQRASRDTGTECPPGFCRERINDRAKDIEGVDEGCFDNFVKHCMGEYRRPDGKIAYDGRRMFTDADCKAYVLRDEVRTGPNGQRIANFMSQMCKAGGRFAASQPLCQCLLADDERYCTTDDCFARQNRALANLARCAAPQCIGKKGSNPKIYRPPVEENECAEAVCAPLLQLKCVNLQSEEAITILVNCANEGTMTDEQLCETARKIGVTCEDVKRAQEARGRGELTIAKGGTGGSGGTEPDGSGGTEPDGSGGTEPAGSGGAKPIGTPDPTQPSKEESGLPSWAYAAIAGAVLLFLVLVFVAVGAARKRKQQSSAYEILPAQEPGYSFSPGNWPQ